MREYVFVGVLAPDTVGAKERLKMICRKDVVVTRQTCFIVDCVSPFYIGAVTFFFQTITSFMLDVTMIIAFCIFSLKGTID